MSSDCLAVLLDDLGRIRMQIEFLPLSCGLIILEGTAVSYFLFRYRVDVFFYNYSYGFGYPSVVLLSLSSTSSPSLFACSYCSCGKAADGKRPFGASSGKRVVWVSAA